MHNRDRHGWRGGEGEANPRLQAGIIGQMGRTLELRAKRPSANLPPLHQMVQRRYPPAIAPPQCIRPAGLRNTCRGQRQPILLRCFRGRRLMPDGQCVSSATHHSGPGGAIKLPLCCKTTKPAEHDAPVWGQPEAMNQYPVTCFSQRGRNEELLTYLRCNLKLST